MLYTIIGRVMNGVEVEGYILEECSTKQRRYECKKTTYLLALSKQINNAQAQKSNGAIVMKGTNGCKLINLRKYNKDGTPVSTDGKDGVRKVLLTLTGKIIQGKGILGYTATYIDTATGAKGGTVLTRSQAMECARLGVITNARYQKSNGAEILRGVDYKLASLPIVKPESLGIRM